VDTERTLGRLAPRAQITVVPRPEDADLIFINTCAFIGPAVKESVRRTLEIMDEISGLPPASRPLLAVAGCLVGRYGEKILAPDLPEADLILDNRDIESWSARINAALAARKKNAFAPFGTATACAGRLLSTGPSYAWLKISDGCDRSCSFCAIPSIRGPHRSSPPDSVRDEAARLLEQGVRELVLVAQDLTSYGKDLKCRHGLNRLLEKLLPLPGLARLRLMYLYPSGVTKNFLSFLRGVGPPLVPYFDVPVQHVSESVLALMGRPSAGDPERVFQRIRAYFPEAALRTTLIAGHPGENPANFDALCAFVEKTRFHHLGVFAFKAEEGTGSASLPDNTCRKEKERRRSELMRLQSAISAEILKGYVGQRLSFLVDAPHGEWPGLYIGRAWFQAPEVDGVTYISGAGVVPGALPEAEVAESSVYDLTALSC
jgi:tRNA-2-methylthio-N6-dimethylallyladenosine synthase/ribosomal protein S12 methylthiotransferase